CPVLPASPFGTGMSSVTDEVRPSDAERSVLRGGALPRLDVEPISMQRAHQLTPFDLAEHSEISPVVRARTFDEIVGNADRLGGDNLLLRIEGTHGLSLGTPHTFLGERSEEAVHVLVERASAPGFESAR